jgi:subtilisin family serine protease
VVASLLQVPGVVSVQPVWGDKYAIATTLSAAQVGSLPGVSGVDNNNLLALSNSSLTLPNDPDISQEYYVANTGQTVNGQAGTPGASGNFVADWPRSQGAGVVIADIDTGVDLQNPDLAQQILPTSENFSVSPPNGNVQAEGTASGFYHATTVDGVMVAQAGNNYEGAGAAPQAKVLALKCGDSGSLSDSCIYAAGEYAISQHVKIINMSFGEDSSADPVLASLVANAQSAGILITASAGNAGTDNDNSPVLPANYSTTYANVIAVGATDDQDNLASFSDYGGSTVDLMAPGTSMFTDYPTYTGFPAAYVSGTSYAAPLVAAAAALLWSADAALTYSQVKLDILSSSHPVAALAGTCVTGARLDAQAALALVQSTSAPSSPTTTAPGATTSSTLPVVTTSAPTTVASTTVPTTAASTTTVAKPTTTTTVAKPTTTTTVAKPTTTTTVAKPKPTTTTTVAKPKPTTTTTAVKPTTTTAAKPKSGARPAPAGGAPGYAVDSVAPNVLPASGGDLSIFGSDLPANPTVEVGGYDVAVSFSSSTEIDLMVGAMPPGTYSVTVSSSSGAKSVTLRKAVSFSSLSS